MELTSQGWCQSWNAGFSRGDYLILDLNLLRYQYHPSQVLIVSTDKNRTYHTAKQFANGLYPFTSFKTTTDSRSTFDPTQGTIFEDALSS